MEIKCPNCTHVFNHVKRYVEDSRRCPKCKKRLSVYIGTDGLDISVVSGNPWKNAEGYTDSTAYLATR